MAGFEGFTVLAILDAKDKASKQFERAMKVIEDFGGKVKETADVVKGSGDSMDESLAQTASGVDPLELAAARLSAAQDRAAASAQALADAEQQLLAVTAQGVASDEEQAAAADALSAAQSRQAEVQAEVTGAAAAQRDALAALIAEMGDGADVSGIYLDAQGKLRDESGRYVSAADAQRIAVEAVAGAEDQGSAAADALAAANDRLAAAQTAAADAAGQAAAAQARQDALVTQGDVATAAANLSKAEKAAKVASNDLAAAEQRQADVQKAVAASTDEAKAAAEAEAAAQKKAAADAESSAALMGKVGKVAGITALGMGAAGGVMVKAAANFQDSTVHLVTDAGVAKQNLGMVQAGILKVSTQTGQSAADITNAMYHIASSGYTAQNGLNVLKVAAEGARVGGANLDTTSKALVGTLTAYDGASLSAGKATTDSTKLMQELIKTVGSGDMRMQDLAGSLASVAPLAAAAHIKFSQVGGAIATMTAQGFTADRATQDLANTIRALENPSAQSTAEMAQLGLNSQTVAQQLGSKGLTGTIYTLTKAITSHMGKSGQVIMSAFNQSTVAAQDANIMLSKLPSSIQGVAKAYLSGSASYKTFYNATKGAGLQARTLAQQFAAAAGKAHGFSSILTSGSPAAQTYTAALRKLTGNATAMNTVMMLSGGNMGTFEKNAAGVAAAGKKASGNLAGWSKIQGTFNFKLAQAKTGLQNTGIAIGSALLPAATSLLQVVTRIVVPVAEWTAKHKTLTEVLFVGVTAVAATVAAVALATKAFKAVKGAVDSVKAVVQGAASLFRKLGSAARASASEQEAASGEAAAAQEADAAESAAAQEEAAAESSAGWVAAAAQTVAQWAKTGAQMVVQAAVWVAQQTAKVAVVVAENVAAALSTAGAWIAAYGMMTLGIAAVVALVVVAVVEIVKHWNTIVAGVKKAWNAVYDFISKIVGDVITFVKAHWDLIVGIVAGPLGLAAAEIVKHWNQIKAFVSRVVSDVIGFVKSRWRMIVSILGAPLAAAVALVTRYWGEIKHWFTSGVSTVLGILRGLGRDVISVGGDIVRGLWHGISGMGGWLWGQVKGFASSTLHSLESALGIGSPSKYTIQHGMMLAAGLAQGIQAGTPQAVAKGRSMASLLLNSLKVLNAAKGGQMSRAGAGLPAGLAKGLADGNPKAIAQARMMAERTLAATQALNRAKAGKMHTAGQGLVQGIWQGISGSVGWLTSNIAGFASNVLHGISSALGIGSPSRYTKVHGQMLGLGLANGITASVPQAVAAAAKMAAKVLAATSGLSAKALAAQAGEAPGTGSPLAASAVAPARGGASGGVTIIVDVHGNTVMSNGDIDRLTNAIGKRLANTVLPGGGRKLNIRG